MHLVLLETAGNQNYIFSTNKLKENIGASELTYRAGTMWVLEAISEITDTPSMAVWRDSQRLRQTLLNPDYNPPIEVSEANRIEIIVAASGKALVITRSEEDAKCLIQKVTHKALVEAPGLEITGVFVPFDWENAVIGQINRATHKLYEKKRSTRAGTVLRFLKSPLVSDCQTSGLPASEIRSTPDNRRGAFSQVSVAKQDISERGRERVEQLLRGRQANCRFADNNNDLEASNEIDWLAIIHADGNGLGEIFQDFHTRIGATTPEDNRRYIDTLRKFSIGLDICTENAFLAALDQLPIYSNSNSPSGGESMSLIPLTPLILGGDDLTVVCEGRSALPFVAKFLLAFEQQTAASHPDVGTIVADIAEQALGVRRLSACAGVAIVKLHFPFSVAYDLAEGLMTSAKQVKTQVTNASNGHRPYPCSALDFHIVYDASDVTFDRVRAKLETSDGARLYNRPYVVTPLSSLEAADGHSWARFHDWQDLCERVRVLTEKDDEGRYKLPNSQVHDLRVALYQGQAVADARYRLMGDRYRHANVATLAGSENSLFQLEPGSDVVTTALIDALDASTFMGA